MKSCGNFSNHIDAKRAVELEKDRREHLCHQRVCLKKLRETYGFSWPYFAHSLSSLSIPIYVEKTKHLKCLKDLEKYIDR